MRLERGGKTAVQNPNQFPTTQIGKSYEQRSKAFLESRGVQLLEENFRLRLGEIDLIGIDQSSLVFFEVRFRRGEWGSGIHAMDGKKLFRVQRAARVWLQRKGGWLQSHFPRVSGIRFDLLSWNRDGVQWVKDVG